MTNAPEVFAPGDIVTAHEGFFFAEELPFCALAMNFSKENRFLVAEVCDADEKKHSTGSREYHPQMVTITSVENKGKKKKSWKRFVYFQVGDSKERGKLPKTLTVSGSYFCKV